MTASRLSYHLQRPHFRMRPHSEVLGDMNLGGTLSHPAHYEKQNPYKQPWKPAPRLPTMWSRHAFPSGCGQHSDFVDNTLTLCPWAFAQSVPFTLYPQGPRACSSPDANITFPVTQETRKPTVLGLLRPSRGTDLCLTHDVASGSHTSF